MYCSMFTRIHERIGDEMNDPLSNNGFHQKRYELLCGNGSLCEKSIEMGAHYHSLVIETFAIVI